MECNGFMVIIAMLSSMMKISKKEKILDFDKQIDKQIAVKDNKASFTLVIV